MEENEVRLENFDMASEQKKDPYIVSIFNELSFNPQSKFKTHYLIKDSVVYFKQDDSTLLELIPQQLIPNILEFYHSNTLAHVGRDKMFSYLKRKYYWPGMYEDIKRWVSSCLTCGKFKSTQPKHQGLLQPIKPTYPFEIVGVDILGPIRKSRKGNKYILVFIDFFTNWVEACPLKTLEAEEVAWKFYTVIITRHGCPRKVLTDQGTQFTSTLFRTLCKKFNIVKLEISSKHPQSNGKTERFIRFLSNALATVIKPDQSDWDDLIDDCLLAYRVTINHTIQETPFFLLYGRDALLPADMVFGGDIVNVNYDSDDLIDYKVKLLERLRVAYETAEMKRDLKMNYFKEHYDLKHKDVSFQEGSKVLVYWPVPKKGYTQKLLPKWKGPYKVIKRLSPITYRIEKDKKPLTVHVQRLKEFKEFEIDN